MGEGEEGEERCGTIHYVIQHLLPPDAHSQQLPHTSIGLSESQPADRECHGYILTCTSIDGYAVTSCCDGVAGVASRLPVPPLEAGVAGDLGVEVSCKRYSTQVRKKGRSAYFGRGGCSGRVTGQRVGFCLGGRRRGGVCAALHVRPLDDATRSVDDKS